MCRWYPPSPGRAVAQCGTAARLSLLWSSVCHKSKKKKKIHPQTFQGFPALGKIPTYQETQSRQKTREEMSTPCPPTLRDQSRAHASGPQHPCPGASKGMQVALGKWRKAEERQAAAKAACCHKASRLPWTGDSTAATQPTVQHIRCWGRESPQEYHLPATTSSPHPLSHHSIATPNLPTINCC